MEGGNNARRKSGGNNDARRDPSKKKPSPQRGGGNQRGRDKSKVDEKQKRGSKFASWKMSLRTKGKNRRLSVFADESVAKTQAKLARKELEEYFGSVKLQIKGEKLEENSPIYHSNSMTVVARIKRKSKEFMRRFSLFHERERDEGYETEDEEDPALAIRSRLSAADRLLHEVFRRHDTKLCELVVTALFSNNGTLRKLMTQDRLCKALKTLDIPFSCLRLAGFPFFSLPMQRQVSSLELEASLLNLTKITGFDDPAKPRSQKNKEDIVLLLALKSFIPHGATEFNHSAFDNVVSFCLGKSPEELVLTPDIAVDIKQYMQHARSQELWYFYNGMKILEDKWNDYDAVLDSHLSLDMSLKFFDFADKLYQVSIEGNPATPITVSDETKTGLTAVIMKARDLRYSNNVDAFVKESPTVVNNVIHMFQLCMEQNKSSIDATYLGFVAKKQNELYKEYKKNTMANVDVNPEEKALEMMIKKYDFLSVPLLQLIKQIDSLMRFAKQELDLRPPDEESLSEFDDTESLASDKPFMVPL